MFQPRRALPLSWVGGVIAAAAFAVPANAGTGVHVKCMSGISHATTNPRLPAAGGKADYQIDMPDLSCTATESPPMKVVTLSVDLTSFGKASSFPVPVPCGTGKWISRNPGGIVINDIQVSPDSKIGEAGYTALFTDLKYELEFIGGIGGVYWHNAVGKHSVPVPKPLEGIFNPGKPYEDKATYHGGIALLAPPAFGAKPPEFPPMGMCPKGYDFGWMIDLADPKR